MYAVYLTHKRMIDGEAGCRTFHDNIDTMLVEGRLDLVYHFSLIDIIIYAHKNKEYICNVIFTQLFAVQFYNIILVPWSLTLASRVLPKSIANSFSGKLSSSFKFNASFSKQS